MRRKWGSAITALLAVSVIVSACNTGDAPAETDTSESGSEDRPKIIVNVQDRPMDPSEGTPDNNRWTRWIQENAPVDVDFIVTPFDDGGKEEKWNALFASGDAPDLIYESLPNLMNDFYNRKQLMPLDDLLKHSPNYMKWVEKVPELLTLNTKSDGKVYHMGVLQGLYPNRGVVIRQDWLEKLGLQAPKTTDELLDVARAFATQDPDGDGQHNTYGISLSGPSRDIFADMFGVGPWILKDGTIVREFDRSKAYAQFRKTLYEEGIVDRDFLTDTEGDKAEQDFINGKVGIYGAHNVILQEFYEVFEALKTNDPEAEIVPIKLPQSPAGSFGTRHASPLDIEVSINAQAKDPVAVMKFIDWMISEETMFTLLYGFPGEHYVEGTEKQWCPKLTDKWEKEVSYSFKVLEVNPCKRTVYAFENDPTELEEEFLELVDPVMDYYYDPVNAPIPQYTDRKFYVSPDRELSLIDSNASDAIEDIWSKAIVTKEMTVDQAFNDVLNIWKKSGGEQVEQWYKDWYAENKDTWVFTPDQYEKFSSDLVYTQPTRK